MLVFYSVHTLYVIPSENTGTPQDTFVLARSKKRTVETVRF